MKPGQRIKPGSRADMDDGYFDSPYLGAAHGIGDAPGEPAAGVLWVPDPESRRGWREFYIPQPQGTARCVGFRKRTP